VVFSFQVARSPVRRVGIVRGLSNPSGLDQMAPTQRAVSQFKRKEMSRAEAVDEWPETANAPNFLNSHQQITITSQTFANYAKYKRVASPFFSYASIREPDASSTTAGLQDKVKELDERLKKLESETLRELQEGQEEELKKRADFVQ
jgi:hypothetical protein